MSIAEVKARKPFKVAKGSEDFLAYKTSVIGKGVFVLSSFTENQRTLAKYLKERGIGIHVGAKK